MLLKKIEHQQWGGGGGGGGGEGKFPGDKDEKDTNKPERETNTVGLNLQWCGK